MNIENIEAVENIVETQSEVSTEFAADPGLANVDGDIAATEFEATTDSEKWTYVSCVKEISAALELNDNINIMKLTAGTVAKYGAVNLNDNSGVGFEKYSEEHLRLILDFLAYSFPDIYGIELLPPVKLYPMLAKDIKHVGDVVFNRSAPQRFIPVANDAGAEVLAFNTFDKEQVPFMNTTVTVGAEDEILGEIIYQAVQANTEIMVRDSVVDRDDSDKLNAQLQHTWASYIGYHKERMGYGAVLVGGQGSGKSLHAKILAGASGYSLVASIQKLTGKFAVAWEGKVIIITDEAKITSQESADSLKGLMTDAEQEHEGKGENIVQRTANYNNIFTTNRLDSFKTLEVENRRYFVITANGELVEVNKFGHKYNTPIIMLSPKAYAVLRNSVPNGFLVNDNNGVDLSAHQEFFRADVNSDKVQACGNHAVSMAQIGYIMDNPKAFFAAFKHFGILMAKHYEPTWNLANLEGRIKTKGDLQLSLNVTADLGVEVEHNRVTDLQDAMLDEEVADNVFHNEDYIDLSALFDAKRVTNSAVYNYFKDSYTYHGQAYRMIEVSKTWLLIKGRYDSAKTVEGMAEAAKVKSAFRKYSAKGGAKSVMTLPDALRAMLASKYSGGIAFSDKVKLKDLVAILNSDEYGQDVKGISLRAAWDEDSNLNMSVDKNRNVKYSIEEFDD